MKAVCNQAVFYPPDMFEYLLNRLPVFSIAKIQAILLPRFSQKSPIR
jgi:hypothetical protein